jgi:hypothetical protein
VDAQGGEPKVLVDNVTVEFTKKISTETQPRGDVQIASGGSSRGITRQAGSPKPAKMSPLDKRQPFTNALPETEAEHDYDALLATDDLPPEPEMPPWEQEWRVIHPPVDVPTNDLDDDEQLDNINSEQPRAVIDPALQPELEEDQELLSEQGDVEKITAPVDLPDWDELAIPVEDEPDFLHLSIPTMPRLSLVQPEHPVPKKSIAEELTSLPLSANKLDEDRSQQQEPSTSSPSTPVVVNPPTRRPASSETVSDRPLGLPPYLVSPTPPLGQEGEIRMVTVVLRSSGDKTRDVLRLRRIHGILMSYPGEDRFALQVYERGRFFLMEFPNFSCGICQDLMDRLAQLVGRENLRVETLRYQ